ncbi:hypothetical protein [Paenibacillus cineris]|uniref:hypothetical protein n=1 Tax=Paenibacillus cineris TaxID=237530 RepID=UPI001B16525E|nr:hypothetical protein [Paenibacillus cineris]GIO62133.1 hypothetical protein J43TS9_37070 [Paenibacillus cineris]
MLEYRYDPSIIQITESVNEQDAEFRIRLLQEEPYLARLKQIRRFFEDNDIYTDALFYVYKNHDFVLALMKHQLLQSVEWKPSP